MAGILFGCQGSGRGERFPSPSGLPNPIDPADTVHRWESPDLKVEVAPYYSPDAVFDASQSGLVKLDSIGDASLSESVGALAVYRTPDGLFYSQEAFEGGLLMFKCTPFTP